MKISVSATDPIAAKTLIDRLALAESRELLRQRKRIAELEHALEVEQQRVLRLRARIARLLESKSRKM